MAAEARALVERVFREESGQAVATLIRVLGDFDLAEEAVQEAFTAAVQSWPTTGLPPSPAGWIITTARNKAIDRLRRERGLAERRATLALLEAVRGQETEIAQARQHLAGLEGLKNEISAAARDLEMAQAVSSQLIAISVPHC